MIWIETKVTKCLDKSVDKHDRKTSEEEKYADDTQLRKDTQMC